MPKKKDIGRKQTISRPTKAGTSDFSGLEAAPALNSDAMIKLIINGTTYELTVEPNWTLARVLRDELDLTGTKMYCDRGSCGYCTVIMDGRPILSCMTLAIRCDGKNILTIEGLSEGEKLHPIQQAWIEENGYQCGACTPGMIMSTKALLDKHPNPTEEEIRMGMSGNLCLCGNYRMIKKAVIKAAKSR